MKKPWLLQNLQDESELEHILGCNDLNIVESDEDDFEEESEDENDHVVEDPGLNSNVFVPPPPRVDVITLVNEDMVPETQDEVYKDEVYQEDVYPQDPFGGGDPFADCLEGTCFHFTFNLKLSFLH